MKMRAHDIFIYFFFCHQVSELSLRYLRVAARNRPTIEVRKHVSTLVLLHRSGSKV